MANQNFNNVKPSIGHPAYRLNPSSSHTSQRSTLPLIDRKPTCPALFGSTGLNFDKNENLSFKDDEV
jgi:hypothetical protein